MHRKKVIAAIALSGILIAGGTGGYQLWKHPATLNATYTGAAVYQNETVSEKDFDVENENIFKHQEKTNDYSIKSEPITQNNQELTVKSGKLKTTVKIPMVAVKKIIWDYGNKSIYEGDSFDENSLSGEILFSDGTKEKLSSFTIKSAPDKLSAENNTVNIETPYGDQTTNIPVIKLSSIETVPNSDLYEGTHKKKDFSFKAIFEDGKKEDIPAEKISLNEVTLKIGKNNIEFGYEGKNYTAEIEAKEKTAAIKASETYKDELTQAAYKHISDSLFLTVQKLEQNNGHYYLTHVVVNSPDQIKGGLSYDSFGGQRELPTDVAARTGAALVINGSYFSYDTGKPACAGVFIKNGEIMQDGTTNGNEICLDKDGKLFSPEVGLSASDLLSLGVRDSWGTADPLLLQDGKPIYTEDSLHGKFYPRTTIGMKTPGEYYVMTAVTNGYSGGLSFVFMQQKYQELGCTFARSLDGGGSSSLVFEGNLINNPAAGSERPVVDTLYVTE